MELEDSDFEPAFVGRESYLDKLANAWKSHAIFGIFGIKAAGKSRLLKKFLQRKKQEMQHENFYFIYTDMKHIDTKTESLNELLLSALGQKHVSKSKVMGRWKENLVNEIRNKMKQKRLTLAFDNVDGFLEDKTVHDEFLSLCVMLIKHCRGLKIFITSTIKFLFTQIRSAYYQLELMPMAKAETMQLLRQETVDIKLGEAEELLAELCEGLPKLVLMIVSELTADDALLQPQEMVELLLKDRLKSLSREFYPTDDRVADEYNNFLLRLPFVHQNQLAALKSTPGTFCAREARDILGYEKVSSVNDEALIPIRRRYMITNDPQTGRFNIHGILRDCMEMSLKQSNDLDKTEKDKTISHGLTKDGRQSSWSFEHSLLSSHVAGHTGKDFSGDTVSGQDDKIARHADNLLPDKDQCLSKECKMEKSKTVTSKRNIEETDSDTSNTNHSFCGECGTYSLTDNTLISEAESDLTPDFRSDSYESDRKTGVRSDRFGEPHISHLDKTFRQLNANGLPSSEKVLKESERNLDLRMERLFKSHSQKMNKSQQHLTWIRTPAAVSEGVCSCTQCQKDAQHLGKYI